MQKGLKKSPITRIKIEILIVTYPHYDNMIICECSLSCNVSVYTDAT